MQKNFPLIAIYDAHTELEHLTDTEIISRAHSIAESLAKTKLGVTACVGSPVISTILTKIFEKGHPVLGLSPASSSYEHLKAYRLPHTMFPLIYTGRGALGADVMALSSATAVLVVGGDEESLLGILGCINTSDLPIAIFTKKNAIDVRAFVTSRYPKLVRHVIVSDDPDHIAREFVGEIRKRSFE